MKVKEIKLELEVDMIGGEGTLTVVEELALSEYFKQRPKKIQKIILPKAVNASSVKSVQ